MKVVARTISGGCQCGAVRFEVLSEPVRAGLCHCRMCQRATGGVFAPLLEVRSSDISWSGAEPAFFASSNIAERGFCPSCGTPLCYRTIEGDKTELMAGALDDPEQAAPTFHYAIESKVGWVDGIHGLPGFRTGAAPGQESLEPVEIVSRQAPVEER